MSAWRSAAVAGIAAAVGVAGTLVVATALGMPRSDRAELLGALLIAAGLTLVAAVAAMPLLRRASMRQRFLAIPVVSLVVALANLFVLTRLMFLSKHDATLVGVLLLYAVGAGVGVAMALARSSTHAVGDLVQTARTLGEGDLSAEPGAGSGGAELDVLASTMRDMAGKLREAQEGERAAEAVRRDLIAAVSHDLRTPLASLRAMIEAIDEGVVDDAPTLRRYATEMRRSATQLSSLVDDLFELAQLDAGAIQAETERTWLLEVVDQAVATVHGVAVEKGLSIVTEVGDAAQAPCSPRLARVLQNLLVNAVRHTPADGTVRVRAVTVDGRLEVAVEDTGEGIAPEDRERVFEPFFRGDAARSGPGAGLGLPLAKRIVEHLGGRIRLESAVPTGSRFAIDLPLE